MTSPTHFGASLPFAISNPDDQRVFEDGAGWKAAMLLVRRKAMMIFLITVLISLAAVPIILSLPQQYSAETRFMVSPTPIFKFAEDATGRMPALDIAAEVERLASQDVVKVVIDQFAIAELSEFNPDLKEDSVAQGLVQRAATALRKALQDLGIGASPPADLNTQDHDRVTANFRNALSISQVGTSNVVRVGFSSRDPVLAAKVPGAMVDAYLAQSQAHWTSEIAVATDWLESWIAIGRTQLHENEAAFERFRSRSALESGDTELVASNRLSQIEERLLAVRRERLDIAGVLRSVEAAKANPDLPSLSQPPQFLELRKEHQRELRELEKAASVYGANTSAIAFRKSRIAAITAEISTELSAQEHVLNLRDKTLSMEEDQLAADSQEIRSKLATLQDAGAQLTSLAESLRAHDEALSLLEYRKQSLLSQAQMAPINLDILSSADVPVRPEGVGRKVYLAGASLGGILCALLLAGISELRDRTVRSHEQLSHLPGIVPVGLWPALNATERRMMASDISTLPDATGPSVLRDMLLMLECSNRGAFPKVLTVTSPSHSDSESPIAEWIALQLAAGGRKVQFIEARKNRVPVNLPRTGGKNSATGDTPQLQYRSLLDVAQDLGGNTDKVLSALLKRAKAEDMITIINAPPLLSKGGMHYARVGDGLLLVMGWGRTLRPACDLAAGLLRKLGVHRVFSLITDANPRRHRLYGFTDRLSLARNS